MDGTDKRLGLVPLRVRFYLAKYSRMFGPSRSTYHPVTILLSIELSPLDAQMPLVELQPQGNGRGNPALPHLHDLECVNGILRGNRSGHNVDHIERRQVLENVRPHIKDWWE